MTKYVVLGVRPVRAMLWFLVKAERTMLAVPEVLTGDAVPNQTELFEFISVCHVTAARLGRTDDAARFDITGAVVVAGGGVTWPPRPVSSASLSLSPLLSP